MVPDETSDLPTTLPEASFLNPNRKVPSEARSLRGLFPVPVFAEFPSYSLSKNADGFLQNPFWLSYCNLRKLKQILQQFSSDFLLISPCVFPVILLRFYHNNDPRFDSESSRHRNILADAYKEFPQKFHHSYPLSYKTQVLAFFDLSCRCSSSITLIRSSYILRGRHFPCFSAR